MLRSRMRVDRMGPAGAMVGAAAAVMQHPHPHLHPHHPRPRPPQPHRRACAWSRCQPISGCASWSLCAWQISALSRALQVVVEAPAVHAHHPRLNEPCHPQCSLQGWIRAGRSPDCLDELPSSDGSNSSCSDCGPSSCCGSHAHVRDAYACCGTLQRGGGKAAPENALAVKKVAPYVAE